MDTFGTAAQIKGAMLTVFQASRATGRTSALLRSLHDGDLVVFKDNREADRVKRLAKEMGLTIKTTVVDPRSPEKLMRFGTQRGQLLFDHSWLEDYYLAIVEDAYRSVESLRQAMSGEDERHAKTRLAAKEIQRWGWVEPHDDV